jgi:hypothetical protein
MALTPPGTRQDAGKIGQALSAMVRVVELRKEKMSQFDWHDKDKRHSVLDENVRAAAALCAHARDGRCPCLRRWCGSSRVRSYRATRQARVCQHARSGLRPTCACVTQTTSWCAS